MINEIRTLRTVKYERIIRLFDVYETDKHVNLVFEFMGGGTLFQRVREKEELSEVTAMTIFTRLMQAVAYLHGLRIVHRDLKPENVFLETSDSDVDIKLADFGLAVRMTSHEPLSLKCGTPGYMAPEILNGEKYDEKADVYSCGVILFFLYRSHYLHVFRLTSQTPFEGTTTRDVLNMNRGNEPVLDAGQIRPVRNICKIFD